MKRYTIRVREYQDYDLAVEAKSAAEALRFAEENREAGGFDDWLACDPDETEMSIIATDLPAKGKRQP